MRAAAELSVVTTPGVAVSLQSAGWTHGDEPKVICALEFSVPPHFNHPKALQKEGNPRTHLCLHPVIAGAFVGAPPTLTM